MTPESDEQLYRESEVAAIRTRAFWGGIVVGVAFCLAMLAMLAT
jgi:hypothetical protein